MRRAWAFAAALLLAACDSGVSASRPSRVPEGEWGGAHVRLTVTSAGGTIELDCGHGTLDAALELDDRGRFDVKGSLVREGGPVREGAEEKRPARYSGTSDGQTMDLTAELEGSGPIGSFQLTRGATARLVKCL